MCVLCHQPAFQLRYLQQNRSFNNTDMLATLSIVHDRRRDQWNISDADCEDWAEQLSCKIRGMRRHFRFAETRANGPKWTRELLAFADTRQFEQPALGVNLDDDKDNDKCDGDKDGGNDGDMRSGDKGDRNGDKGVPPKAPTLAGIP